MQGYVKCHAEACVKKVFIHNLDAGLQCTHLRDRQETAEPAVHKAVQGNLVYFLNGDSVDV